MAFGRVGRMVLTKSDAMTSKLNEACRGDDYEVFGSTDLVAYGNLVTASVEQPLLPVVYALGISRI